MSITLAHAVADHLPAMPVDVPHSDQTFDVPLAKMGELVILILAAVFLIRVIGGVLAVVAALLRQAFLLLASLAIGLVLVVTLAAATFPAVRGNSAGTSPNATASPTSTASPNSPITLRNR